MNHSDYISPLPPTSELVGKLVIIKSWMAYDTSYSSLIRRVKHVIDYGVSTSIVISRIDNSNQSSTECHLSHVEGVIDEDYAGKLVMWEKIRKC